MSRERLTTVSVPNQHLFSVPNLQKAVLSGHTGRKEKDMYYDTGFDFFRDLVISYGKEQAIKIANCYLDMQINNKDPKEFIFCCELYRAVQQTDKYY